MRKEVIAAILLGGALGLAIAFGVWRASTSFAPERKITQTEAPTPTITPTISLTIASPVDSAVVSEEKITLSGKTVTNATVVVATGEDEAVATADQEGNWEAEVGLVGGANAILVVAFAEDGESTEKEITIVYSTEFKGEQ